MATTPRYKSWDEVPLLLSSQEVADFLGVHMQTVKKLITQKEIPAKKVGRAWRITKDDLKQYMENKE